MYWSLYTPQINATGFIDDTYQDHRGTHLESRICTRSRGGSSSIDKRLRDDFIWLKTETSEWGQIALNYAQTADVIKRKHNAFCVEIEQMEEVFLAGGGLNLVYECGILRFVLNEIRRFAKQLTAARAQPDVAYNLDTRDEPMKLSCPQMVPNSKELSYSKELSCTQISSSSQELSCSEELPYSHMLSCSKELSCSQMVFNSK